MIAPAYGVGHLVRLRSNNFRIGMVVGYSKRSEGKIRIAVWKQTPRWWIRARAMAPDEIVGSAHVARAATRGALSSIEVTRNEAKVIGYTAALAIHRAPPIVLRKWSRGLGWVASCGCYRDDGRPCMMAVYAAAIEHRCPIAITDVQLRDLDGEISAARDWLLERGLLPEVGHRPQRLRRKPRRSTVRWMGVPWMGVPVGRSRR